MSFTRFGHPLALFAAAGLALTLNACGKATRAASTAVAPNSTATHTTPATTSARSGGEASVVVASARGITASMRPHSHDPVAERPWPINFTVTRGGQPVQASVSYEYLFAGQVVARRSHYNFHGHFADTFIWPDQAVGYPLTFRAVIVASGVTIDLDYPVRVVK